MSGYIVIPARSGSTRIRGKNVRLLGGKPLVAHVIASAIASGKGRVIVSTNCEDISRIARENGADVPFKRPKNLSGENATSLSCILHAVQWIQENEPNLPNAIAFCPPTTPFLSADTVTKMFESLEARDDVNSVATIYKSSTHPFTIVGQHKDGRLQVGLIEIDGETTNNTDRSQDYPKVWHGSPACRITRSTFFLELLSRSADSDLLSIDYPNTYDVDNCIGFEINRIEAFDINDEQDWLMAEAVIEQHLRRTQPTS